MELSKTYILLGLAVVFLLCRSEIEARPRPPTKRHQYRVEDAEAAASDWSDEHDHEDRDKRHHHHHHHGGGGVTGPIHTFVKTDKHANFKWGVRHHVGHKYS